MNMQLTLALRYLSGRKLRTFLTTLAIMFGVLIIFGMNIILPTMLEAMQANILAASGQVDLTITRVIGDHFDQDLVSVVLETEGIRGASGTFNRTINLPAGYFDDLHGQAAIPALTLIGIDPENISSVRSYPLQDGRFLQTGDTRSVVISDTLADNLGLSVGDGLKIPTVNGQETLTIVGILFPKMAPGNEEILVPLAQVQQMMNAVGKINAIEANMEITDNESRRNQIAMLVQERLGDGFQYGAISTGDDMVGAMEIGRAMLNFFGVLALFMGAFIIFNTFRTVLLERRHDIGLLRAVGASRKMITWLIILEGLIQGVIGSILGLIFGYLMGLGIIKLAQGPMSTFINLQLGNPVVTPGLVMICLLLGVGVSILAGLFPALQAARVTPLEALRPSVVNVDYRRRMGFMFVFGLVLIALGVLALFTKELTWVGVGAFLFLVGLVFVLPALVYPLAALFGKLVAKVFASQGIGELAQGNLTRQPGRVTVTVSTSMLGLAVVVAAGGLISSLSITMKDVIQSSLGSDFLLLPPSVALWSSDVGAQVGFVEDLRAVEGVEAVSSLRFAGSQVGSDGVSILGIDPAAYPQVSSLQFIEGSESDYALLNEDNTIFINGIFASVTGVKAGDTLDLVTPDGVKPYRVVSVAGDLLNAKVNTVYISQANLERDFKVLEDVFIQINLKSGADFSDAEQAIKALAADYPQFTVLSGQEYYQSLLTQLNTAFSALYFLLAFLALPSLIAMINTLAIAVMERSREIGMLRAVGATRKQVRSMITAEALLMAIIGTGFGILGGLYLGYLFIGSMEAIMPSVYVFPTVGIIAAIVIGLSFGVLAAVIPAKQAAKLDVVQALRYE